MMNLLKKSTNNNTKTAVQMTKGQKPTTTVANISSKVKTAAFGVATGAGVAGSVMLQNERNIRNRKARAEYHRRLISSSTTRLPSLMQLRRILTLKSPQKRLRLLRLRSFLSTRRPHLHPLPRLRSPLWKQLLLSSLHPSHLPIPHLLRSLMILQLLRRPTRATMPRMPKARPASRSPRATAKTQTTTPRTGTTRTPMQQSDAKALTEYVLSFGCLARPP